MRFGVEVGRDLEEKWPKKIEEFPFPPSASLRSNLHFGDFRGCLGVLVVLIKLFVTA